MQPFIDAMEGRNRYTNPRSTCSLSARVFFSISIFLFRRDWSTDFTFLFSVMKPAKAIFFPIFSDRTSSYFDEFASEIPISTLRLKLERNYSWNDYTKKTHRYHCEWVEETRESVKRVCREERLGLDIYIRRYKRARTEGILDGPRNDEESTLITVRKFNFPTTKRRNASLANPPDVRSNRDIFERIRNEHSNDDNMQTRILNSKLRCPLIRSTDVTSLIFFGKIHLERLISYRNPGLFSVDFLFSTKTFFRRRIDASRLRLTAVVIDDYMIAALWP